jgi:hypothetical protein
MGFKGLTFTAQSQWGYLLLSFQNTEKYLPTLPHDCNYSAETVQTIDMDAVYLRRSAAMWSGLHIINIATPNHHQLLPSSSP